MFFHVTEDPGTAGRILRDILSPMLNRPEEEMRRRLLVGPAQECAEKVVAYRAAGAQRLYLWPLEDEARQLTAFREQVVPLVHTWSGAASPQRRPKAKNTIDYF